MARRASSIFFGPDQEIDDEFKYNALKNCTICLGVLKFLAVLCSAVLIILVYLNAEAPWSHLIAAMLILCAVLKCILACMLITGAALDNMAFLNLSLHACLLIGLLETTNGVLGFCHFIQHGNLTMQFLLAFIFAIMACSFCEAICHDMLIIFAFMAILERIGNDNTNRGRRHAYTLLVKTTTKLANLRNYCSLSKSGANSKRTNRLTSVRSDKIDDIMKAKSLVICGGGPTTLIESPNARTSLVHNKTISNDSIISGNEQNSKTPKSFTASDNLHLPFKDSEKKSCSAENKNSKDSITSENISQLLDRVVASIQLGVITEVPDSASRIVIDGSSQRISDGGT